MDSAYVLAIWLHTVAFVIAWGYYGVLGRIVLPALERSLDGAALGTALVGVERRALPLVLVSLVLFTLTGTYLLVIDPDYAGLGDFFDSTWTTLMLVKHLLVVAFVGLGVVVDRLVRRVAAATTDDDRRAAIRRLARTAEGTMGLGAVIALLTAAAQVNG